MVAINSYPKDYVEACASRMRAQLAAYKSLGGNKNGAESFERLFFTNLILVLDNYFAHRTRAVEGKDGNPLSEVRLLCTSLLRNHGVLTADKTITYKPEESVLGLRIGDEILVDEAQFLALFEAYFAEIKRKFT